MVITVYALLIQGYNYHINGKKTMLYRDMRHNITMFLLQTLSLYQIKESRSPINPQSKTFLY